MLWTTELTRTPSQPRQSLAGALAGCLLVLVTATGLAGAQGLENSHVLSTFGDYNYEAGFERFDYVNPDAPKGGVLREGGFGTFDSLNYFSIKGTPAGHVSLIYDSLFEGSLDEPLVNYGLIAESVSFPDDYSSVTFKLRAEAQWHDGQPITPEDVIFSLDAVKAAHPGFAYYYKNVVAAEKTGEREVTFRFDTTDNRELPNIVADLTILPKHFWEGTNEKGEKRDLASPTLDVPLGSGPYRVKAVDPGSTLTLERVEDYWAKDLAVNVGRHNFDEIEVVYFRDRTVMLEAFKADNLDIMIENQAKRWATAYEFPAAKKGDVITDVFQTKNPQGMQGFVLNTRRPKFADPRVRLALNYAFDFEWTNKHIFYGQYTRTPSYFAESELAATGLPEGLELELLERFRGKVPDEVFTTEFKNPVANDRKAARNNFRTALRLLKEAGWKIRDSKLVNAETGEHMQVEFLVRSPDFERVILPYKKTLDRLGIGVSIRTVDTSQYGNRLDTFDFDITVGSWGQSLSPGNEQRNYWGSAAADRTGSRNLAGIKDPVIDELIDEIISAENREVQIAATKALDRVLLWSHYVVPNWFFNGTRMARWDRFGLPDGETPYGFDFRSTWWYDEQKAKALEDK